MRLPASPEFRTRLFQAITDRFPTHRIHDSAWARGCYRLLLELIRPNDTIVLRTPHYRIRYRRLPRRQIARYIAIKRAYEPLVTGTLRDRAARGGLIVDVGANIGHFTLVSALAAGDRGHVVAFEPAAEIHAELQANVALNGLGNVTCVQAALGAAPGTAKLHRHQRNPGGHSLSIGNVYDGVGEISEIPVLTLDQVVEERFGGQRVTAIKLDVEGSEPAVLAGAQQVLARDRPALILEYWPFGIKNCGLDAVGMLTGLEALGYRLSNLEDYESSGRVLPTTAAAIAARYTAESRANVAYLLAEANA
jgi:FkbM family methyltransferase